MAVRNDKLGGTDWAEEGLRPLSDLNNTVDAIIKFAAVGHAQNGYQSLQSNNVFENKDFLAVDEVTVSNGTNRTINTSNTTSVFNNNFYENQGGVGSYTDSVIVVDSRFHTITGNEKNITVYVPSETPTGTSITIDVNEYFLNGFSLSSASYDGVSFDISTEVNSPRAIRFKDNGTKMYVLGSSNDSVYQYSLSTAWDLSTASYDSVSFDVSTEDTSPLSFDFKSDGTKMYVAGTSGDSVYQYSLSTAWDLSTASYDSVSFDVSTEATNPIGIRFKDDGTKMYIVQAADKIVYQYSLSTAWDLSTASYDSVSFDVSTEVNGATGISFKSDGTKMYMLGANDRIVHQYSLSTAWDLSTASYDSVSFDVSTEDTSALGLDFKSDGKKMYVVGSSGDNVYQYSMTSASLQGSITENPVSNKSTEVISLSSLSLTQGNELGIDINQNTNDVNETSKVFGYGSYIF